METLESVRNKSSLRELMSTMDDPSHHSMIHFGESRVCSTVSKRDCSSYLCPYCETSVSHRGEGMRGNLCASCLSYLDDPALLIHSFLPIMNPGVLTGGQMSPGVLLQQRLRCGQVREALDILEAMDWSTMGDGCFRSLSSVTNHLLRLPLNAETEGGSVKPLLHFHSNRLCHCVCFCSTSGAAYLQEALAVFYAPPTPLPDTVILAYRDPISKYARRFFHHLLR